MQTFLISDLTLKLAWTYASIYFNLLYVFVHGVLILLFKISALSGPSCITSDFCRDPDNTALRKAIFVLVMHSTVYSLSCNVYDGSIVNQFGC